MSKVALHKGGSAVGIDLIDNDNGFIIKGLLHWNIDGAIYYFSNYNYLNGAKPVNDDWKRFGYIYSYHIKVSHSSDGREIVEINNHLPSNIRFHAYGGVVEPGSTAYNSSKGEEALKADIAALPVGYAIGCQITTSNFRTISGRLFRNKERRLYVLHNDPIAKGTCPSEPDWEEKSGYKYSWCLLEDNLHNDCRPETYMCLGPAMLLYDYTTKSTTSKSHQDMQKAISIIEEHMTGMKDCRGARVEVKNTYGVRMNGVLIKQRGTYYMLHDNPEANGDKPYIKLHAGKLHAAGVRTNYSWNLDCDLFSSSHIQQDSFRLLYEEPVYMSIADPMNPVADSKLGGVVEPLTTKEAARYDARTFEQVTPKNTEPELILFKKPTAKVTRCDIQPMQSPQIITKNKK